MHSRVAVHACMLDNLPEIRTAIRISHLIAWMTEQINRMGIAPHIQQQLYDHRITKEILCRAIRLRGRPLGYLRAAVTLERKDAA